MSKTKKGSKSPGYEHWGKRPNSMSPPGKVSKQITKSKERMQSKQELSKIKKGKEND
jgi:hypothetical protein